MNLRMISSLLRLLSISLLLMAASALGQTDKRLGAREIFYSPPVGPTSAVEPSPRVEQPPRVELPPARRSQTLQANRSRGGRPVATSEGSSDSLEISTDAIPSGHNETTPVSYSSEAAVPLGLRYSILKRESSGSIEVDPGTALHSGDKIRLRIDVNTAGYLYIINRGSSGNWNPLFPSSKIANGDNRVQKGTQYEIPPGFVFTFDEQAGAERLFIVFSRRPVSDLEELIYSLTSGQKSKTPTQPDTGKVLLAQANIQDGTIDRLRNVYSRDLIIEKVDETKPPTPSAPAKEKAVYVVNPSRSADSRLVADVTLIHK